MRWTLELPRSSEDLFDAAAFERDERLPYWADLWPSAKRLARHLLDAPAEALDRAGTILELGCGVGLASLAIKARGGEPIASAHDHEPDALRFARWNAERNGLGRLATLELDWRSVPDTLRASLVVGADVLYERRNAVAIAELLPKVLVPGGEALLADPRRPWRGALIDALRGHDRFGWSIEETPLGPENGPSGAAVEIVLVRVTRR